jgi:hypothetical protein
MWSGVPFVMLCMSSVRNVRRVASVWSPNRRLKSYIVALVKGSRKRKVEITDQEKG